MIIRTCNGCARRIADSDAGALRNVPMPGADELFDWCGPCVAVIRAELPRLAAEARRALYETRPPAPVRSRALRLWDGPLRGVAIPKP